jgi:hypothetical protein
VRKTEILWRGETFWLRNVIAHELSHKYSLDVLKRPIYLSARGEVWIDDEGVEGDGSYLFEHNRLPYWFVEGLAQVGSYRFGGDKPDPYREMLLRDSFLHGCFLTLDDMARYERSSRERELVYNQGFYFLLFLLDHKPHQEMDRFLLTVQRNGLEDAVVIMYGTSLENLYHEWVEDLAVRFSGFSTDTNRLETVYPEKQYPFVAEIASTGNGRYVIANWGNDSPEYSLFEKRNDSHRRVADDVGTVLRRDPVTGAIWYNRLVYEAKNDREQFELFRLSESGRPEQILEDTRTRAFDVYDDTVVLASYQYGITKIEQYDLDSGARRLLYELPSGTAVYSISLMEDSGVLVTVGDGQRIRLFRWTQEEPVELWPKTDADIVDALYIGDGRVVFSSTLDGTPQLYAASLGGSVDTWHKLTEVSGGALRPVIVNNESGKIKVVCSVYEDGSFKLKRFTVESEAESMPVSVSRGVGGLATGFPEYQYEEALLADPLSRKTIGENLIAWAWLLWCRQRRSGR